MVNDKHDMDSESLGRDGRTDTGLSIVLDRCVWFKNIFTGEYICRKCHMAKDGRMAQLIAMNIAAQHHRISPEEKRENLRRASTRYVGG